MPGLPVPSRVHNHEDAVVMPGLRAGARGEAGRYAAFFDRFRAAARFCPRPMVFANAKRACA